jgi:hypothetical protein
MLSSRRVDRKTVTDACFLVIFGVAFGYVEAAVVVYLRTLIKFRQNYALSRFHVYLNLGFIEFVKPAHALLLNHRIADIEVARESATIVMLVVLAYLVGKNAPQRLGAFLTSFACWDISYYGWLRILDQWPRSFFTRDVYFLIPVTWIGPVLTPLVICTLMVIVGVWLFVNGSLRRGSAIFW